MGDYHYPAWGEFVGFSISLSSMLWVPGYALYYLLTEEGTLSERLRKGVTPVIRPRLEAMMAEEKAKLAIRDASDVEINMAEAEGTALVPESL